MPLLILTPHSYCFPEFLETSYVCLIVFSHALQNKKVFRCNPNKAM